MRHFTPEQWVDFVRNTLRDEDKSAMNSHLQTGCRRCLATVNKWIRVKEAASRERDYRPPDSIVRQAKGLAALYGQPTRTPIAQLLFDSVRDPMLAGVRSAAAAVRQMLYAVGEFRIDLRLEPKVGTGRVSLVGQILVSSDPARPASGIRVTLVQGSKTIAAVETNEFGEFDLECDATNQLQLKFVLPPEVELKVPLSEPSGGAPNRGAKASDSVRDSKAKKKLKSTRKEV